MSGVPYIFANATTSIPLSELDVNFSTPVTIGNTTVALGNTVTSFGNVTLVNTTISSGNATLTSVVAPTIGAASGSSLSLQSNGTTNATLDTNGNFGLGVTPSAWASGYKSFQFNSKGALACTSANMALAYNFYDNGTSNLYLTTDYATLYQSSSGKHIWYNAPSGTAGTSVSFTQAMTLDNSGNLLVGTTTDTVTSKAGLIYSQGTMGRAGYGGTQGTNVYNINWTGSAQLWIDTTNIGTITIVSDYRIKKNISTQTIPALDRISQIRPVTYEFGDYKELYKADGVAREGFIAHELQAVIPSAVEGEKDAENQIQSLKLDALCSVMVKAIQELSSQVTTLQSQVTALQAKVGV